MLSRVHPWAAFFYTLLGVAPLTSSAKEQGLCKQRRVGIEAQHNARAANESAEVKWGRPARMSFDDGESGKTSILKSAAGPWTERQNDHYEKAELEEANRQASSVSTVVRQMQQQQHSTQSFTLIRAQTVEATQAKTLQTKRVQTEASDLPASTKGVASATAKEPLQQSSAGASRSNSGDHSDDSQPGRGLICADAIQSH